MAIDAGSNFLKNKIKGLGVSKKGVSKKGVSKKGKGIGKTILKGVKKYAPLAGLALL